MTAHTTMVVARPSGWTPLAALVLGSGAIALQQTMIFPALAVIERDLGTTTGWVTLAAAIYLLAAAVATPIVGRLGDQFGKRTVYLGCLWLFLVGSVGSGVAPDVGWLILFRALAGAGAAAIPLAYAITKDTYAPSQSRFGIGLLSAVLGAGGAIGFPLGGVVVDHLSWRWVFAFGPLLVVPAIGAVARTIPRTAGSREGRFDVPGALLLSGATGGLLTALAVSDEWGWGSRGMLSLLVAAVLCGLTWALVELRTPSPMVDLRMLGKRVVFLANLTAVTLGFAQYAALILVPRLVQGPQNGLDLNRASANGERSATEAGIYLLPLAVAMVVAGPVGGLLSRRFGPKRPLTAGMVAIAGGLVWLAESHAGRWDVMTAMLLVGLGMGLAYACLPTLIVENVEPRQTGVASGMNQTARWLGAAIGAQAGAAIVAGAGGTVSAGFSRAFWIAAVAATVAALLSAFITPLARRNRTDSGELVEPTPWA